MFTNVRVIGLCEIRLLKKYKQFLTTITTIQMFYHTNAQPNADENNIVFTEKILKLVLERKEIGGHLVISSGHLGF